MRVSLILYIRQQILKSFFYKTFFERQKNLNRTKLFDLGFHWWTGVDSNHRSRRRQIYSLIHLAALDPVRLLWCSTQAVEPVIGLEPTTC